MFHFLLFYFFFLLFFQNCCHGQAMESKHILPLFYWLTERTSPGANQLQDPHPRFPRKPLGEHMRTTCTDVFFKEAVARTTHSQREGNWNVNWTFACVAGSSVFASFCSWIRRSFARLTSKTTSFAINDCHWIFLQIKNTFHSPVLTLMFKRRRHDTHYSTKKYF